MKKLKIYVGARFSLRSTVRSLSDFLENQGFEITEKWFLFEKESTGQISSEALKSNYKAAKADLYGIESADATIFLSENPLMLTRRGGRHVEFGYALALKKPIIVLGPKENVFHYLSDRVTHIDSYDQNNPYIQFPLVKWLTEIHNGLV